MKKDLLIHEVPDAAPGWRGFIRKATLASGGARRLFLPYAIWRQQVSTMEMTG